MQQAILSSTRVRLGATPLWYGPEWPASFQGCPTPAKAGARPSWQCLLALVMQMLNRGRSAGDSAAADLSRIQERQRSSVFMPPWSVCCDQRGKDGGGSLDCQCTSPLCQVLTVQGRVEPAVALCAISPVPLLRREDTGCTHTWAPTR